MQKNLETSNMNEQEIYDALKSLIKRDPSTRRELAKLLLEQEAELLTSSFVDDMDFRALESRVEDLECSLNTIKSLLRDWGNA